MVPDPQSPIRCPVAPSVVADQNLLGVCVKAFIQNPELHEKRRSAKFNAIFGALQILELTQLS
jgi:hypothetical protein